MNAVVDHSVAEIGRCRFILILALATSWFGLVSHFLYVKFLLRMNRNVLIPLACVMTSYRSGCSME